MKTIYLVILAAALVGCSTTKTAQNNSSVCPTVCASEVHYHHILVSESSEGETKFLALVQDND